MARPTSSSSVDLAKSVVETQSMALAEQDAQAQFAALRAFDILGLAQPHPGAERARFMIQRVGILRAGLAGGGDQVGDQDWASVARLAVSDME